MGNLLRMGLFLCFRSIPSPRGLDHAHHRLRGMKILYVEDNEDNIYMLKNWLSRAGFTVIVATDGI